MERLRSVYRTALTFLWFSSFRCLCDSVSLGGRRSRSRLSRRSLLCSFPWFLDFLLVFLLVGILIVFVVIFASRISVDILLAFIPFYKGQLQHCLRRYRGPPSTRFFGPWCARSDGPPEGCSRRFPLQRRFVRRLCGCLVAAWRWDSVVGLASCG